MEADNLDDVREDVAELLTAHGVTTSDVDDLWRRLQSDLGGGVQA